VEGVQLYCGREPGEIKLAMQSRQHYTLKCKDYKERETKNISRSAYLQLDFGDLLHYGRVRLLHDLAGVVGNASLVVEVGFVTA
jgi:hypothetical protein